MTRSIFFVSCIALILVAMMACFGDSVNSPPAIIPVTVAYGDTATVPLQGVQVRFDALIHDSRCPPDALCVWEGLAEIIVSIIPTASATAQQVRLPILLSANPVEPATLMPVDTFGYRITLLELTYPAPANDSEYVATIELYKFNSQNRLDDKLSISDLPPNIIMSHGFDLDTAYIEGDRIHLTAIYSGGCEKHYFWLYMSPSGFAKSNPVQADFYLRHWSYIDPCDQLVSEDLVFDLGPMIELYQNQFGSNDDIIVNMYHYSDTLPPAKTVLRYYGADSLVKSLLPMAVGNRWVYARTGLGPDTMLTTWIDTIDVTGTFSEKTEIWWELTGQLPLLGDTIMLRGDSVYRLQQGWTLFPSLEFIPAVDTPITYPIVIYGDIGTFRKVWRLAEPFVVEAGTFLDCYAYTHDSPTNDYGYIIAPGVGIIYAGPFDTTASVYKTRLVSYELVR